MLCSGGSISWAEEVLASSAFLHHSRGAGNDMLISEQSMAKCKALKERWERSEDGGIDIARYYKILAYQKCRENLPSPSSTWGTMAVLISHNTTKVLAH
jgi:hypothetical protein